MDKSSDKLIMVRYNGSRFDKDLIKEMLKSRGMPLENHMPILPHNGVIIYIDTNNNVRPVAYGALRLIEGNAAMVDGYITNKDILPYYRNEALEMISKELRLLAKELKLTKLIAFTSDNNTLMRTIKHGFVQLEQYKMIVLSNL